MLCFGHTPHDPVGGRMDNSQYHVWCLHSCWIVLWKRMCRTHDTDLFYQNISRIGATFKASCSSWSSSHRSVAVRCCRWQCAVWLCGEHWTSTWAKSPLTSRAPKSWRKPWRGSLVGIDRLASLAQPGMGGKRVFSTRKGLAWEIQKRAQQEWSLRNHHWRFTEILFVSKSGAYPKRLRI